MTFGGHARQGKTITNSLAIEVTSKQIGKEDGEKLLRILTRGNIELTRRISSLEAVTKHYSYCWILNCF